MGIIKFVASQLLQIHTAGSICIVHEIVYKTSIKLIMILCIHRQKLQNLISYQQNIQDTEANDQYIKMVLQ